MNTAPRDMWGLNNFQQLADSLGHKETVLVLGVSDRVFASWYRGTTPVPKCAVLALYWESPYGRSQIDADHHNEVTGLRTLIGAYQRQVHELLSRIRTLEQARHDCANDLFYSNVSPGPPMSDLRPLVSVASKQPGAQSTQNC